MFQVRKSLASVFVILALLIPSSSGLAQQKDVKQADSFDPVEFIKGFKIGMSYADVQGLLPKQAQQDPLAYVPSEEAFLLSVDIAGQTTWSASFKFDTIDLPARRPEQLIEISCSAGISPRSESFETIVRKVTATFGDPVELDRSQEQFQQAGWRVSGGSVLTLEYSKNAGTASNVNIEFVIKKNRRANTPDSRVVA